MRQQRRFFYRTTIETTYQLRPRRWGRGLELVETTPNGASNTHELTPSMLEHLRSPVTQQYWAYQNIGSQTRQRFKDLGITNRYWHPVEEALTPKGQEIRRLVIAVCGPRNGAERVTIPFGRHLHDDEA